MDEETQTEYGLGLQFTRDGNLRYGLTADDLTTLTGGEFSNWGDIFSNLGDPEGLTEQFQNGGLEGLPIE